MKKLIFFQILVLLLAGCGGDTAVWQPNSATPPRLDNPPPRLLIQSNAGSGALTVQDLVTGQKESRPVSPATTLNEIVSGPYQPVGDILVNETHFFNLSDDLAAPNGLWLVTAENGLTLWRVDGAQVTLSGTGDAPVWSPDGRWLAYRDAAGVWAVDVTAGRSGRPMEKRFMRVTAVTVAAHGEVAWLDTRGQYCKSCPTAPQNQPPKRITR